MTHEEIEHMWKIVSNNPNHDTNWYDPIVVKFAKLVASAEREACAKVCETSVWSRDVGWWQSATKSDVSVEASLQCAAAIRARGQA